ncbi:MAG: MFS transporter [Aliidongia sp.]
MAVFVVTDLPIASLVGYLIVPAFGWRVMFLLGGLGGLIVWYLRKNLPESPRWLESVGRGAEADVLLHKIEAEVARGRPLPPPLPPAPAVPPVGLGMLFKPPLLARILVGCLCLIVINTLLYGFITWLPTFFVKQGLSIATSYGYSLLMALGAPIGAAIGALTADRWGRKPTIIGSSIVAVALGLIYPSIKEPAALSVVGFALTVPIYVLVALLFGIYIPELFPTEVRLRASGICNTFGRGATIVTPFIVVSLFNAGGVSAS